MSVLKPRYMDALNGATTKTGNWLGPFRGINNFGFQCVITGTLTGVFSFEVSEDGPDKQAGSSGAPVQPSGTLGATALVTTSAINGSQPGGSPNSVYFNFVNIAAPWIRAKYTATSGAGNVSVGASGGDR